MQFYDCLSRLSPTAAVLLLSQIFALANAGALPSKTQQLGLRTLDVVNWPLATPAPWLGMVRRQDDSTNTVCGYIGGDPNLPATCSAGSHCAMDASVSAIGCCANGVACTTGVYTSCVDQSSSTQSVVDPYVYTCGGSNVCYRNTYDGGAYQYGCGSSSQGTNVAATASGLSTTVQITRVTGLVTAQASSSSSSTSTNSSSSTSTSSTTSSASRSTSSTTSTTSTTISSTESPTPTESQQPPASSAPPAGAAAEGLRRHGATIGGIIAGCAVFVAIVSVAIWMCKRKRGNQRLGPGLGKGPSYISPVANKNDFAPVPGREMFDQAGYGHPAMMPGAHGTTTSISAGRSATTLPASTPGGYNLPSGASASGASRFTEDQELLSQPNEMEEFQRGFNDAITRGSDNGPSNGPSTTTKTGPSVGGEGNGAGAGSKQTVGSDERPLWQQNRRQSRNLMWM